ncbi:MAG TPA: membrane protein insertion efficiency factor YidD [Acidimicrobiales bacterium]|nr:membrane protein insertion efficiency factor YidD [Acidimicrobiales bacterium]
MKNSNTTSNMPSVASTTPKSPPGARVLLGLISTYQYLRAGRVAPCRFYPSCSNYAAESVATHGSVKGSWLALRRVLRCRPFGPHGIDLVPERKVARSSSSCTQ